MLEKSFTKTQIRQISALRKARPGVDIEYNPKTRKFTYADEGKS